MTDPAGHTGSRPVTPVGVLASSLSRFAARGEAPMARGEVADPELQHALNLATGLEPYVARCTTPESSALRALAERTAAHDWSRRRNTAAGTLEYEMLSGHVEGQFLKMLVAATRARRILEIGMFTGYSALAMAEGLPPDGELVACEIDVEAADIAHEAFAASPHGGKITIEVGEAAATLRKLAVRGTPFDFIFLDADKAGYSGYFSAILENGLLSPGGLMCVDNTLLQGHPFADGWSSAAGESIRDFNQTVADDPRVEQVLVPLRDGVTLVRLVEVG